MLERSKRHAAKVARAIASVSALAGVLAYSARCMIHIADGCPDGPSPCLPGNIGPDGGTPAARANDANVADGDVPDSAAASGFCATQRPGHRLCSDFDLPGESVTQGFDLGLVQIGGVGGTFTLDPTPHVSPPNAALGTATAFPAGGTSGALLVGTLWPLGPTPATVDCSLQWNPQLLSTVVNDYEHVVALVLYADAQTTAPSFSLNVNLQGDGQLLLLEYYPSQPSTNTNHIIPLQVATGGWLPVHMALSASGGSVTYDVSVGGVQAPGGSLALPFPATSHATLQVGPAFFDGTTATQSPGWQSAYDNVVCY